ncbi:Lsr2 family protein [Antrihabitans sp. YC2-6]|uniref:histone-like nucleoid-structuring protein Lsr2 n=1 Tax=Antrihabitans sp. YC2-6 TaxID=2799498 RepID=UPI0018F3FFBC|nr:Lsr2 family protein [Antrihabitans sp. YC2-6]MBJ8343926.1 Lsr2 family protein [Antrihabitans sp. YC2-6]
MARIVKQVIEVTDDFDGKEIQEGLAEAIEFGFEGTTYRIDLRPENAEKFRKDLSKWVAAAAKVTGTRGRPRKAASTASVSSPKASGSGRSKEELANIREWAKKNGHEVSERGRISRSVQDAYDAAHAG